LRNGFVIRHERREVREDVMRLYLADTPDNYLDVPTVEILRFEEDRLPPPPALGPRPAGNIEAVVNAASSRGSIDPELIDSVIETVVNAASSRNNIDPDLVSSVICAESGFNPNAVSRKGARGLMQLMPQTADRLGVQDAMDPTANVEGGTRYLGELLARYHGDIVKALAAYNAGPDRVEQYHGVPPYRETLGYVARVIRDYNRKKLAQRLAQPGSASYCGAGQNSKPIALDAPGRPNIARPAVVSPEQLLSAAVKMQVP
ncbi:MAG TPA: lytic transglycosylase domain-containing protein, partial [Candidatus Acidoferrales bacterium]|nr:lytic transglycosylase domain-containing protein [Candidatus Acidoferrales bacterium]